jgi:formamidopyrimidine-DNA glycosylase
MGMPVPPEQPDAVGEGASVTEGERPCPECGHSIEVDEAAGRTYSVCRTCYEVYVVNAGR